MPAADVYSCEFEVFGKVQGVNFRRHVLRKAKTLGLRGWCMNSAEGTVRGYVEGPSAEMDVMKEWLKTTGSPESHVKRVQFTSQRKRHRYGYTNFQIRPDQIRPDQIRPDSDQKEGPGSSHKTQVIRFT